MMLGFIETSGMFMVVLVIGAVAAFTALPVALGFAALRRIDRQPDVYRGRRLAVSAIIMGVLGFFMLAIIGIFVLAAPSASRSSSGAATWSTIVPTPSPVSTQNWATTRGPVTVLPTVPSGPAAVAPAGRISGQVLSVKPETQLLMLSVGSQQGVVVGSRFTINRGGERLGAVQIDKVYPDMSMAHYVGNMKDVQINDEAIGETVNAEQPENGNAKLAPQSVGEKSAKDDF